MNYQIFNEDHLKDDEIEETVVRVKAFIMNDKNEILIASSNGGVQLIGGHVENEEEQVNGLKREIKEETGIEISNEEISEPFYEVRHYIKNYFNSSKNVIAKMVYYVIKTDKIPNLNQTKLTKQEQDYDFCLKYIPFDEFEDYLKNFLNSEKKINGLIATETLAAFHELNAFLHHM